MLVRAALLFILFVLVARAFWRLLDGIVEGAAGRRRRGAGAPAPAVPMVRDPVCGMFLVADRAVTLVDGRARVYFCSDACRERYRARPSSPSRRADRADPERVDGRRA
jgi:YHS domain-containing protein